MMRAPEIGVGEPGAKNGTAENPARLSAELAGLFPDGVVASELNSAVPRTVLTSLELKSINHCAEKRIDDFTRGRACAHRSMEKLGFPDISLLAGAGREPLWPPELVGSITHTAGFAAAVVARRTEIASLGIDCEVIESVGEDLWERICTPAEQARLVRLPVAERLRQAALLFAAKEAFYKCQFPLSRAWVGFEDVTIEPVDWPATSGSLRIIPQVPLPVADAWVAALVGRYQFREPWVVTAFTALICS